MVQHQVVIAGGGPTGMMLAAELKLTGIDVLIIERRVDAELVGSRAGGLQARSLELLDQRGVVDRFLREGQTAQTTGFAGVHFDLSGFPTRHPYGLGLWQKHIERIFAGWIGELGVEVRHGTEVAGLVQDETGVDVALGDGSTIRAGYLVGCDGGRSRVRKAAGIAFPGSAPTTSNLIAAVEATELPPFGVHRTAFGIHAFGREEYEIRNAEVVFKEHGPIRVMVTEPRLQTSAEPTLHDLSDALIAVCGTDYGVHDPISISRFTDAARQAASYRKGRVLVAGDAAHVHPPDGGQGLNLGLQDAVNLGWKLAQVVTGISRDTLLDSYQAERHPVAARVLRHAMASVLLRRDDDRSKALRETVAELLGMGEPRQRFAAEMSGLGIRYDLGAGHPLLGRRMPDLDLATPNGPTRVYALMHTARPLLLNLGVAGSLTLGRWADRVHLVDARTEGPWPLLALGPVPAPAAVLVRPDGYVAWVGDGTPSGLTDALTMWCGQ